MRRQPMCLAFAGLFRYVAPLPRVGRARVHRNLRWMLSAGMLLAALAARAQERGPVTTLPRPNGPYWLTSDSQQPPPALLPPADMLPPPSVAPGPPPVLIDQAPQLPPIVEEEGAYP